MNTYYLVKSTVECVDAATEADASKRVCDLDAMTTLILMLSTPNECPCTNAAGCD